MFVHRIRSGVPAACVGLALLAGCASERARVSFSYVVQPERGLPPGMKTIYVAPAKVGPTTDPKWSDLSATLVQNLVNESRTQLGADVSLSDRRDTDVTFSEADLRAAGMSTERGGSPGQLLGAQGAILSNIDVKVDLQKGRDSTITGIDFGYFTGAHGSRGGGGAIQTGEVETVMRNMTVQANFRLLDTANNKVWDQHTATHQATERTHASPIFGSSRTAAELTPEDRIVGSLVDQAAREFLSKFIPVRIAVEAEVKSSGNKNCAEGIRMLRAQDYSQALALFEAALRDSPNDHRAAFGAGLAAEASGQFSEALRYYQRACAGSNNAEYAEARDRVKAYAGRAKRG